MLKKIVLLIALIFICCIVIKPVNATVSNSFVTVVNPVRGSDFWDLPNQKPVDVVSGQIQILENKNIPATFLLRFDATKDPEIVTAIKNSTFEKGLFLEVTPTLTNAAQVKYHQSSSWHNAASVLLTGYSLEDRKKLIDTAFEGFKKTFGIYPKSVGAWWIGAESLSYMQQKYGITSAMIVADQYSTDSYQIWGQYWGTPFYPAKNNALFPAQSVDQKIPVVISQWAARDPINGYGTGVGDSTYSVQANDYIDYHNLDINYFSKLVDIYTLPPGCQSNSFCQITVGLENTYSWQKYKDEYQNQINTLVAKQKNGQFNIVTMSQFGSWYLKTYPEISPDHLITAADPLGSSKQAVWYMNPFYRVGWVYNNEGSVVRDLRQYVQGQSEICLSSLCNEVNFATFATRVLDEVTYGQKRVVDEGKITDLHIQKNPDKVVISYNNAAGKKTDLEFLARDISINGDTSTIDGFILDATNQSQSSQKKAFLNNDLSLKSPILKQMASFFIFWVFILFAVIIPGEVVVKKILTRQSKLAVLFLSTTIGFTQLTLVSFLSQVLIENYWLVAIWIAFNLGLYIQRKLYIPDGKFDFSNQKKFLGILIILGTIFLTIPVFRNGLEYGYGIGFWGPNGHDGVWHLALINQLINSAPPQNPILSGTQLLNYHYFYDLLVAVTSVWSHISPTDLLFRQFPIFFGLLIGVGTLSLINLLFEKKNLWISGLALYFAYTAGSFGWIVEMIKNHGWNGESDFWANQAISFNLNPPFMISLLIVIAFFELLIIYSKSKQKLLMVPLILLSGSLFEFKAYGAILVGLCLLTLVIIRIFKRDFSLVPVLFGMGLLTTVLLIPNYPSVSALLQLGSGVFEFSPLWFIHSMIDSPDRLGLTRLSLTRISGYENDNILKIVYSEGLGLVLFLFGNLGLRSLGLVEFFNKRLWRQFGFQIIFIFSLFSIIVPLFFIQKGTPWNTIQFFYYFLFFSSLLSALAITQIKEKLPKLVGLTLVGVIVVLTPINCLAVALGYLYPQPHAFIGTKEVQALDFLRKQPDGVVLTYPFNPQLKDSLKTPLPLLAYETTAYVSAYSAKKTFEEDNIQQQILNFDADPEYIKRIVASKDFFTGLENNKALDFLETNQIKYIYLPKIYKIQLDENGLRLKNIYENEDVVIYQTT